MGQGGGSKWTNNEEGIKEGEEKEDELEEKKEEENGRGEG